MLSFVSAAATHRRLLLMLAIGLYGCVFSAFLAFEVPGLGIGHFFYLPVAMLALAAGTWAGVGGGILAAGLYVAAIFITPRIPSHDALTGATVIRVITFSSCGALIGWFANKYREHVARLSELAERDFLTGLLNVRVFDESLARRCADDTSFVLVLGDLDNLKEINDTHGHTEGNRVLAQVADAFEAAVSSRDELARIGGDEFGVLLHGGIEEAQALCTLLKQRLAREGLELSFGLAARPDDGLGPLELFRKADDRLYAAKLLSRNRRAVLALTAAAQQ
jgi:diguanylate cyclase (GGDEF)-like protein